VVKNERELGGENGKCSAVNMPDATKGDQKKTADEQTREKEKRIGTRGLDITYHVLQARQEIGPGRTDDSANEGKNWPPTIAMQQGSHQKKLV